MNNLTRIVIQLALISEEHPVTHFVVLTITRIADYGSSTSLKMLAWPLSFDRETRAHLLGIQARKGPNTQDQAGRLMAVPCHLFEHTNATYHPLGVAEVAEKSSNTQWAF